MSLLTLAWMAFIPFCSVMLASWLCMRTRDAGTVDIAWAHGRSWRVVRAGRTTRAHVLAAALAAFWSMRPGTFSCSHWSPITGVSPPNTRSLASAAQHTKNINVQRRCSSRPPRTSHQTAFEAVDVPRFQHCATEGTPLLDRGACWRHLRIDRCAATTFAAFMIWAMTVGDFKAEMSQLLSLPWGMVVTLDVYIGLALFSAWMFYREEKSVVALLWTLHGRRRYHLRIRITRGLQFRAFSYAFLCGSSSRLSSRLPKLPALCRAMRSLNTSGVESTLRRPTNALRRRIV